MAVATFEGVATGTPASAAAVGFDFLSAPAGGGADVRNDGAYRGTQYLRLRTGTAGGSGYAERSTSLGVSSSGTLHLRVRLRMPALPPDATGVRLVVLADSAGAFIGEIHATNTGALRLRSSTAAVIGTSATTYVAGQWVDIGLAVLVFSATVGQLRMVLFSGQDTIAETITSSATLNTLGAGGANRAQVGAIRSSGLNSFAVHIDDFDHSTSGSWPSIPAAAGYRYGPWSGAVTPGGFTATYWLSAAASARLVVSTSSDLSSPVYGPAGVPDADGVVKLSVTGLAAFTQYHYGVEADGVLLASGRGECKTFPAAGTAASYSLWFGSCQFTVPSDSTYAAILARSGPTGRALLGCHMGDLHYRDWGAGTTAAQVLDQYRVSLASASMAPTLAKIPTTYMWDNHDWGGDTSDRTAAAGDVVAAQYRRVWPHYPLAASNGRGGYQSFVCGRIRFIQLDTRSYRDPQSDPASSSKTMLGAEQKAWFKAELLKPEPVKIVLGQYYWRYDSATSGRWGSYGHEFDELNAFISANRTAIGGVYVLFGDRHALAASDGTDSSTYGIPQAGGAPIQQGSIAKAGSETWSQGYYDVAPSVIQAYGWLDVEDDGDNITLAYKGVTSLDGVVRVQMTTTFSAGAPQQPMPGLPVA